MKNNRSKRPVSAQGGAGDYRFKDKKRSNASAPQKKRGGGTLTSHVSRETSPEPMDIARIITRREGGPTALKSVAPLPELLAPAGSIESLKAAIAGGADAVYFGGGDFNARINAKNFSSDELRLAIDTLHSCGRKAYITLNTLVHGREMESYLRFAEQVYLLGADALIVADLGGAQAIHRHLPELELHASTQMSGHSLAEAELLSKYGFSRMVCARELSEEDMRYLVKNSPIEIEAFVHGALCVCHSGQCLFSSLVGGRSGNRGQCAQPCRLPYTVEGKEGYPLSLKDLSLASHITELIDIGVQSLKIEGRMKSPEYVFGVTRAFRTLLDDRRDASAAELSRLAAIFSRDGFTDGYYTSRIDSSMLGTRSDEQKRFSRLSLTSSERMDEIKPVKHRVTASARLRLGEPSSLTLTCGDISATALGDAPAAAINAPLSRESVIKSLSRFGGTELELEDISLELDESVMLPISSLNSLRRDACARLTEALSEGSVPRHGFKGYEPLCPGGERRVRRSARFTSAEQITDAAREYFDIIYLPLDRFSGECNGVILPPVIMDSESERVEKMLSQAVSRGARYALVGNLGAIEVASRAGLEIHGDIRFNVYNSESVAFLESLGVSDVMLSPELTLPQLRDVEGDVSAVVYGRVPLMLLEKCVASEISDCASCSRGEVVLTDRRGVDFPVRREFEHRNVIYNSAATYMADKRAELVSARISSEHFIFSVESADEVDSIIDAYRNGVCAPRDMKIRRI